MKRGTMIKNKYQALEEEWADEMDMGNILGVGEEEIPELVFSDDEDEYMVQNKTNGNWVKVMKKKATRNYRKAVSQVSKEPATKVEKHVRFEEVRGKKEGNGESKESKGNILRVKAKEDIDEEWEYINVTVDSGAVDHVVNEECGKQFGVRETEMSKKGGYYVAANNTKIYNKGERDVKGYTEEGRKAGMTFQVAGVNGPLGSVRKMCKEGNRVVFDEEGSFIEDKKTGMRTKIQNEGEAYILKLKVKKGF